MRFRIPIALSLAFVMALSCKEKDAFDENITTIGYDHYLTEEFEISDHFKKVDVVPLETNESCLLGTITGVVAHDSIVVVTDHLENVLAFDTNGRFRYRVGSRGRGPQEYLDVSGCYIDPYEGSINILEISPAKVHSYSITDGKYLSTRELSGGVTNWSGGAILVNRDKLLIFHNINPQDNDAYSLYDFEKGEKESYGPYQITLDGYMYQFSLNPMTFAEDGVDFILPIDPIIYNVSANGFSKKYKIDLPSKLIDTKQMQNLSTDELPFSKILKLAQNGDFAGFNAIFESNDRFFLPFSDKGMVPGVFIADKKTLRGNYYLCQSAVGIKEVPFLGTVGIPGELFTSSKDYIVGIAPIYRMQEFKKALPNIPDDEFNRSFVSALKNFKEDDNPCLFLYYF